MHEMKDDIHERPYKKILPYIADAKKKADTADAANRAWLAEEYFKDNGMLVSWEKYPQGKTEEEKNNIERFISTYDKRIKDASWLIKDTDKFRRRAVFSKFVEFDEERGQFVYSTDKGQDIEPLERLLQIDTAIAERIIDIMSMSYDERVSIGKEFTLDVHDIESQSFKAYYKDTGYILDQILYHIGFDGEMYPLLNWWLHAPNNFVLYGILDDDILERYNSETSIPAFNYRRPWCCISYNNWTISFRTTTKISRPYIYFNSF